MSAADEPPAGADEQADAAVHDTDASTLGERATRSTFWAILGYGGGQMLRFFSNLILTRLLFEEAFGMMAIVNVLMQGLELFSDIGTQPAIVQNARGDDPRFLNTAWTLQVGRGFFIWLIACAVAWPAAEFYGEPDLLELLPVVGLAAIFQGFISTKLYTVSRHLNLKRLTLLNVGSQFVSLVVMIGWALISPTIWALAAGALVGPFMKLVLSHAILPGLNNKLFWESKAARELFTFGRWIFFSTVLTFLTSHADRLIFGKLVPLDMLGIYSIGSMLAIMPAWGLGHLAASVTFPLFARAREAGMPLRPFVRRVRFPFLLLGAWSLSGLCGGGQVAINLLYDDRYAEAGWIVQLLSIMSWLMIMEDTNRAALLSKGAAHWMVSAGLAKLIGMIVFIPLGFERWQFMGAVGGFVAADGLKHVVTAFGTWREDIGGRPSEIGLTVLGVLSAGLCYLAAGKVAELGGHVVVQAAAVFVTATAVFGVVFVPYGLHLRREGNPFRVEIPSTEEGAE